MISISERFDEIKSLKKALAKQYKIKEYEYKYPLFYIKNDIVNACGLLEISKKKNEIFKTGTFFFPQPNGKTIQFDNVFEYQIFIKNKEGIFKYLNNPSILEEQDMEDVYFVILKLMNNPINEYKNDELLFTMCLYHNDSLIIELQNVCRKIYYYDNISLVFAVKNADLYDYWMFKNNELLNIGSGESSNAYKVAIENVKKYDFLKHYKESPDYIDIYFHSDMSESFLISFDFAKETADILETVKNLFDDDDSINYVARYKKNRIDEIAKAFCILSPTGTCLYGHVIDDMIKGLEDSKLQNYFEELSPLGKGCNEYYKLLINDLYNRIHIEENYTDIPNEISEYLISANKQRDYILDFLNKNHPAYKMAYEQPNKIKAEETFKKTPNYKLYSDAYNFDYELIRQHWLAVKEKRNLILSRLIADGVINRKWKNEVLMYKLIKKRFEDAVYQYNAKWLGRQTLDVFIPSLNVAFEYQGVQHYQAVEYFGGIAHFEKQQELDIRKKTLCENNSIYLIEWKFNEPVNDAYLRIKLSSYDKTL